MQHPTTTLVNEEQAAQMLGVKASTMRRWRHLGKGPRALTVGTRAIRYEPSALDAFLDQCRRNSGGAK